MTGKEKLYWAMNDARTVLENGWTQGTEARLPDGRPCDINNIHAAQFCIMGSFNLTAKCSNERQFMIDCLLPFLKIFDSPTTPIGARIACFNDAKTTTLEDVLSVFDEAMDSLKQETTAEMND